MLCLYVKQVRFLEDYRRIFKRYIGLYWKVVQDPGQAFVYRDYC